eukprot:g4922.t1
MAECDMNTLVQHFLVFRGPREDLRLISECPVGAASQEVVRTCQLFCTPRPDGVDGGWRKAPACWSFVTCDDAGRRRYGTCLAFPDDTAGITDQNPTYVAMCILSSWHFLEAFRLSLEELFVAGHWEQARAVAAAPAGLATLLQQQDQQDQIHPGLEDWVLHLCKELPVPSATRIVRFSMGTTHPGSQIHLKLPAEHENPALVDAAAVGTLLRLLDPGSVATLLKALLLEDKVVFHCQHVELLTPAIEAALALLFPFVWHCPYIPYLPPGMLDLDGVVSSPTPIIVGVHSTSYAEIAGRAERDEDCDWVSVDLNPAAAHPSGRHVRIGSLCKAGSVAGPKGAFAGLRDCLAREMAKSKLPSASSASSGAGHGN